MSDPNREPTPARQRDTATPAPPLPHDAESGKWRLYIGLVSVVLLLDVVTKVVVQRTLPEYRPVPVLGDFFRLTYIFNPGAAFGLHLGEASRFLFAVLALVAVVILFFFYRSTPREDRWRRLAIALVTGGALGNFIDRIRSPRGVIDFLDFGFGDLRWPVFNVADIAVTTGAILLAISLWNEEPEEDGKRAAG
jgi:signal peptidase II